MAIVAIEVSAFLNRRALRYARRRPQPIVRTYEDDLTFAYELLSIIQRPDLRDFFTANYYAAKRGDALPYDFYVTVM